MPPTPCNHHSCLILPKQNEQAIKCGTILSAAIPSVSLKKKKRRDRYVLQNGMLRSVVTAGSAGKEKYIGNDDDVEWNLRGKENNN